MGASRVQGMGRHSHEEVMEMGRKDLKALSLCLGECQGLGYWLIRGRACPLSCVGTLIRVCIGTLLGVGWHAD